MSIIKRIISLAMFMLVLTSIVNGQINVPYFEDFESYEIEGMPTGWTGGPNVSVDTIESSYVDNKSLKGIAAETNADISMQSPIFTGITSETNLRLNYQLGRYYVDNSWGFPWPSFDAIELGDNLFQVKVNGNAAYTVTTENHFSVATLFQTISIPLADYAGQNISITIEFTMNEEYDP